MGEDTKEESDEEESGGINTKAPDRPEIRLHLPPEDSEEERVGDKWFSWSSDWCMVSSSWQHHLTGMETLTLLGCLGNQDAIGKLEEATVEIFVFTLSPVMQRL